MMDMVPMVSLAVSNRSSAGQSRKDRLALVPEGMVMFSETTESFLISQYGSEPLLVMWRDRPLFCVKSTVHRTTRDTRSQKQKIDSKEPLST